MRYLKIIVGVFILGLLFSQPGPPQNLALSSSYNAITIQWDAPPDETVDFYNVYRNGEFYTDTELEGFTDQSAMHDFEYCYNISSNNSDGESDLSEVICGAWTLPTPQFTGYETGDGGVQLFWEFIEFPLYSVSIYRDGEFFVDIDQFHTSYQDQYL